MPRTRVPALVRSRASRCRGLVLALWAAVLPASADIYKCTDRAGNITYQNEKCPTGGKAERVDIFDNSWTADRAEKEAQWQRNAAERRVVTGMPANWVREGFGDPAEVKETTTGGASEQWTYNLPDRSLQIGMLQDRVLWFRETPVTPPVARSAPVPAATPATPAAAPAVPAAATAAPLTAAKAASPRPIDILRAPEALRPADSTRPNDNPPPGEAARPADAARATEVPRMAAAPQKGARGRACQEVLAELGKPDRQREIPASDGTGTAMTEYVYEPGGTADPARTRVLCANGKVEGVDRSEAR
jgi:hypothetical protein